MRRLLLFLHVVGLTSVLGQPHQRTDDGFLKWSAKEAEAIGRRAYVRGRVGGFWDTRILKTERSYNYKLAATWLTPDVIRATARMIQLRSRLSDEDAQALVAEAESAADTVVMVEIDPREGSGVIPNDWEAFLQPKDQDDSAVAGRVVPALRNVRAFGGVLQRNYDYDRFWVVFPLKGHNGSPIFSESSSVAELVVRIYNKEGRVEWLIPESIRRRQGFRISADDR